MGSTLQGASGKPIL